EPNCRCSLHSCRNSGTEVWDNLAVHSGFHWLPIERPLSPNVAVLGGQQQQLQSNFEQPIPMRNTLCNIALALVAAAPAWGTIILDTNPSSGSITVQPGATTGWGFTFTATDSNYYVLTGVEFCIGFA